LPIEGVNVEVIGGYWLFYNKYENRAITELLANGIWRKLFAGILIGCEL
jgi:hypothetical protein